MNYVRKKLNYNYASNKHITGKGVTIAVMDTGIYQHSDFENRIIGFKDLINNRVGIYDDNSHGTHVSGICAGSGWLSNGKYAGMAPGCNIVMIKILDENGNGETTSVTEGINWILRNRQRYNIRLLNISVGTLPRTGADEKSAIIESVEDAWDKGIVVVAAAGNSGPAGYTITTPGISKKVITVGSSDDGQQDAFGRVKMNYSGRGPTLSCICKPDIVAPGMNITSCNAMNFRDGKAYSVKSGTSMSTPIVTGAIALLLEKYPDMGTRDVKIRIKERAENLGLPRNRQGWGALDIEHLLSD
ncbi:serine protease AprX [Lachnotalea glycerini]|uniref:Serine protease AprX n=1 Tax=Lachnotalea glycerini TaxID=1763509 RepID=A0A318EXI7_9FIRM|nr:S8 family peptidase [Lachnotalea glycerini]PXV96223.1 serine protease AprX [Lachnotalea glycerini]